jgi:23S rRNA (cytosine1962-C5)-methyltransferase
MTNEDVIISRRATDRIRSGHPWIYRSDLIKAGAKPGTVVRVIDERKRFWGQALYSDQSQIALRLLTREERAFDCNFLTERIAAAAAWRLQIVGGAQAYRLVASEADRLPSLIIDRYGDAYVLQTLSQGADSWKPTLVALLQEQFNARTVIERNDVPVRKLEGLEEVKGVLAGEPVTEVTIEENALRFHCDLLQGQKTGGFLDQRENRAAARTYARGRTLDCFCYSGGFALTIAPCCESVLGLDGSAEALALALRNQELNGISNVEWRQVNCFDFLRQADHEGRRFDTVILDPPALARQRSTVEAALRGYKELNLRALKILNPGGFLITCSCSFHVSEADFLQAVASAALDAHREVLVVERRTQSRDHPILLTVPETHYLKCLILRVL